MFRNITNQKVKDYIDGFYQSQNESLKELREYAEENHVPIFLRDTEMLLISLINISKAKNILEIGTAIGYSAASMASVRKDIRITTIERDDEMYKKAVSNIEKLGLSNRVHLLHGEACECMNILAEDHPNIHFDIIFIDAAKSHYKEFFDSAIRFCHKDSIIICDNTLFKARVVSDEYDPEKKYKTNVKKLREFNEYLFSRKDMNTSLLPVGDGVTITTII